MERLTYWSCKEKGSALPVSIGDDGDVVDLETLCAKLAAYEDTGLTPEQVKAQKWISVKDRLPEKLEPVNIVWVNRKPERYYSEIEDEPFVATGYYWNDKWWWYSATCEDYLAEYGRSDCDEVDEAIEITHWMPLLEPPKEEHA